MDRRFHLYFDDSGSRNPDHKPNPSRRDGVDCFALGGVLIDEDDIGALIQGHREFMARWKLANPLHSTRIRGRRKAFAWLAADEDRWAVQAHALAHQPRLSGLPGREGRDATSTISILAWWRRLKG